MGDDLKDFPEYMEMISGGATTAKIQELNDLMGRKPFARKRGPIEGKISQLLVFWDQQMRETQIKIGKIRQDLEDFVRQHQEGGIRAK